MRLLHRKQNADCQQQHRAADGLNVQPYSRVHFTPPTTSAEEEPTGPGGGGGGGATVVGPASLAYSE